MNASCAGTLASSGLWIQELDDDLRPLAPARHVEGFSPVTRFAMANRTILFQTVEPPSFDRDRWDVYLADSAAEAGLPAVADVCGDQ